MPGLGLNPLIRKDEYLMKNLLLFLLLCLPLGMFAQEAPLQMVHLKNGSVFRGTILEEAPANKISVQLPDGQVIHIALEDIKKIGESADRTTGKSRKTRPENAFLIDKGLYHQTSFGFSGAVQESSGLSINVNVHQEIGYQLNPRLGLGLGSGWEIFSPERGEMIIPAFANLHYYPSGGRNGFNMSLAGGYGFALRNSRSGVFEAEGGYLAYGALGYLWPSSDKAKILTDVGFRLQKAKYTESNTNFGGNTLIRDLTFRRITFRVGILFH